MLDGSDTGYDADDESRAPDTASRRPAPAVNRLRHPLGGVRLGERALITLWASLALLLGLATVIVASWAGVSVRPAGGPTAEAARLADAPSSSAPASAAPADDDESTPAEDDATDPAPDGEQTVIASGPVSLAGYLVSAVASTAVTGQAAPIVVPPVAAPSATTGFSTPTPVVVTTPPVVPTTSAPTPVVTQAGPTTTPPVVITTPPAVTTTAPPTVVTPPVVTTTPPAVTTTPAPPAETTTPAPPAETTTAAPPAEATTAAPPVEITTPAAETTAATDTAAPTTPAP